MSSFTSLFLLLLEGIILLVVSGGSSTRSVQLNGETMSNRQLAPVPAIEGVMINGLNVRIISLSFVSFNLFTIYLDLPSVKTIGSIIEPPIVSSFIFCILEPQQPYATPCELFFLFHSILFPL